MNTKQYQILDPLWPGFKVSSMTEFKDVAFKTAKRISATEVQEIHRDGTLGRRWRSVAVGTYVARNEIQELNQ